MTEEAPASTSQRWQRRERRRVSQRARIKKHGATLRRVYLDAVLGRLGKLRRKGPKV